MAIISHDNKVQNDYYVSLRLKDTHSRIRSTFSHFSLHLSLSRHSSKVGYKTYIRARGRCTLLLMIFVFSLVNALDTQTSSNQRQLLAPTGPHMDAL